MRLASAGKDRARAARLLNRSQHELIEAAKAHAELMQWEAFTEAIDEVPPGDTRRVLVWLRDLFALGLLEQHLDWYLMHGRITAQRARAVSAYIDRSWPGSDRSSRSCSTRSATSPVTSARRSPSAPSRPPGRGARVFAAEAAAGRLPEPGEEAPGLVLAEHRARPRPVSNTAPRMVGAHCSTRGAFREREHAHASDRESRRASDHASSAQARLGPRVRRRRWRRGRRAPAEPRLGVVSGSGRSGGRLGVRLGHRTDDLFALDLHPRGASMPMRTPSPRLSSTVMTMSSPTRIRSPTFRVSNSTRSA